MKTVSRIAILFMALIISHQTKAQIQFNETNEYLNANSKWIFGYEYGVDFSASILRTFNRPPTPDPVYVKSNQEGYSSIAHPLTGDLMFYVGSGKVLDKNHNTMPNGDSLFGDISGTVKQGSSIIPVIGEPNKYYVFTSWGATCNFFGANHSLMWLGRPPSQCWFDSTLYYSIIDMDLNNGLGDIAKGQKNIPVSNIVTNEGMIAIPGNNCDIWLVLHDQILGRFYAYRITMLGIESTPVISNSPIGVGSFTKIGSLTVSPNRQFIAMDSWSPESPASIYRFDPNTGEVSDGFKLDLGLKATNVVGVFTPILANSNLEFSSNNSMLYLINSNSELLQFNISNYNEQVVNTSKEIIDTISAYSGAGYYLRLHRHKIYIFPFSTYNTPNRNINVIHLPDISGKNCQLELSYASLPQPSYFAIINKNRFINGLPNKVVFPLKDTIVNFFDTAICLDNNGSLMTPINISLENGFDSYIWEDGINAKDREITEPGVYAVLKTHPCFSQIDSITVNGINDSLAFSLGEDTTICKGEYINFKIDSTAGATYKWNDGSSNNFYRVHTSGMYSLEVSKDGCTAADSILVSVIDINHELEDVQLCNNEPIDIYLKLNLPPDAIITWSDGNHSPEINIRDTGVYWLSVHHEACPIAFSDTMKVEQVYCDCWVNIPNAFSPNGDGMNDVFKPVVDHGCPISHYSISIYNRFGERVFHSADPQKGWDGSFKGKPLDVGTYFFEIHFEGGTKRKKFYQKGDVTLLR